MRTTANENSSEQVNAQAPNAMVERALKLARDPSTSVNDVMGAVSFLIAWGVYDDAEHALQRVAASEEFRSEIRVLSERIWNLRNAPTEFTDQLLAGAVAIARSPSATEKQLVQAAENLVKWGSLDEADAALERVQNAASFKGRVARLQATSRQLRRSGILSELARLGDSETTVLNRPYELLVARRKNARRAVIVFTGQGRRFWLSLNVLHQFFREFDCHVVYLSDHRGHMYLNGLDSCGGTYDAMIQTLRRTTSELGARRVHVMAASSGGFAGLRSALDLGAISYLGLAIHTDLSPQATVRPYSWCKTPGMLVNLRPLIARAAAPPRILLYCGGLNPQDRAHAENLRGLPTVEINFLEGESTHDTVSSLLARGQFGTVVGRFLAEPA